MTRIIKRSLSLALAAETKSGKSYIGASIVKKYGGIICDFSRVNQIGGFKNPIEYKIAVNAPQKIGEDEIIEVGEAWTACQKVGITEENYKLITNWKDFENAIAYARFLSEDVLKKKIWIVLDDTVAMRWHKTLDIANKLGHKNASQSDWRSTTQELKILISDLSKDFNLFIINQMKDEWEKTEIEDNKTEKQSTGKRVPNIIPNGLEYLVDGLMHIEIDKSSMPYKQYLVIDGGKEFWICGNDFCPKVENITPELIMKVMGISEDRL